MNAKIPTSIRAFVRWLSSRFSSRLLYKLLFIFSILAIAPLLWTSWTLLRVGDDYIQIESRGVRLGIAQKVASNAAGYLDNLRNILQVTHKTREFLSMNPARQSEILSNIMNAYPMFMRLSTMGLSGEQITSVDRMGRQVGMTESEKDAIIKSVQVMGDYVGPVTRSPEGYPQMTIAVPIEHVPGRPQGVLLGVVNLVDLSSLVKDLVVGKQGYVYIVDEKTKELVAHPDIQRMVTSSSGETPELSAAALVPPNVPHGAVEFTDQSGRSFLSTFATVPGQRLSWRVFVLQPIEEAYATSRSMRSRIVLNLGVVILFTAILAWLISRLLVQRVHVLQKAMAQVGEGNFEIPDVPMSRDEFGALSQQFVGMAQSLKEKTNSLLLAQESLTEWNSELEKRVKERTSALQEAQEQLIAQEKLAVLGQMASVVGHELRNPLAVMNNSVFFLKNKLSGLLGGTDSVDHKIDKHISILEGEIVKSNKIISDVLDFSRNRALNLTSHKIDDLIEKALERVQVPPTVEVQKELQNPQLEVSVDEDELRQVLTNLMENACQAMVSGGRLTVGSKAYEKQVEIQIKDTGCGIPQEHLNKIFAPFFTTKSRGTGLGLAVVRKVVERHKGEIEVRSKVGEGTQFLIRLPLDRTQTTA